MAEIYQEALSLKSAANLKFSKKQYDLCSSDYEKAISLICSTSSSSSVAPLSPDVRDLLITLYSNNALAIMKLSESLTGVNVEEKKSECLIQAENACTRALELNPAHAKSLYRRALSFESQGGKTKLRRAIEDASRALQIERNDVSAAELVKRIRKKLEEIDAPLSQTATLELLSSNHLEDALFSVAGDDGDQPGIVRVLRSLQSNSMGSGPARLFIELNGIRLLLSALYSPKASVSHRLTGFSLLSAIATKTIDTYTHEWGREWDVQRSKDKSLGLIDIMPKQLSLAETLASAAEFTITSDSMSLSILKVSTEETSMTTALSRLSVSLLCASLAVLRPQLRTQLAIRLGQWREIKNGTLSTVIPLPSGVRKSLTLWSKSVATMLNRGSRGIEGGKLAAALASNTTAESSTTLTAARVLVTLQGVGQLIQSSDGAAEDCVNILDAERVMENVADWLSSGPADVRRTAAGALTRALTVLRNSHARGHALLGEKKMQDFTLRLISPAIKNLSLALPNRIEIKVASETKLLGGKDPEAAAKAAAESAEVQEKKRIEEEGAHLLPRPDWNADEATGKTASVLLCALQVDFRCGYWLAEQDAVLPAVYISSGSPETHVLQACGDSIAALCSEETGRSLLSTVPQRILSSDPSASARLDLMSLLRRLSESSVASVRSGAAVTMAKLTAPSKGFSAPEGRKGREEMIESTVRLLIASSSVLRRQAFIVNSDTLNNNIEKDEAVEDDYYNDEDEEESAEEGKDLSGFSFKQMIDHVRESWFSPDTTSNSSKGKKKKKSPILVRSVDVNGAARAVEALAVLATHTETKSRLATDKACLRALLKIGASVCAFVGLQKALLSASSANIGTDSEFDERWERTVAPGITIDLRKLPDSVRADACKSELRPTLYGLAHILFSITTSRERLQKAKLAELDVDMEQWKELQRLTMPRADGDGGAAIKTLGTGFVEEIDPPEDVDRRTKSLLSNDVLHLVANIAEAAKGLKSADSLESASIGAVKASSSVPLVGSSMTDVGGEGGDGGKKFNLPQPVVDNARNGAATRELVSLFLLQVSELQWARGIILQGGAAPLLIELAHDGSVSEAARAAAFAAGAGTNAGALNPAAASSSRLTPANTTQGGLAAAQALARVLITTNPTLLSSSTLLDSVGPLIRLAREGMTALSLFEAGMALTNLASSGVLEVRKSLITRRGLAALEDLQFSSHKMVRRAGTEAITNLSTTPEGAGLILKSRIKLWLALSRSYQAVGAIIEDGSGITMSTKAEKKKKKKRGQEILKAAAASNRSSSEAKTSNVSVINESKVVEVGEDTLKEMEEEEEEEEEEIDRDTPTSLAAAGALAMASNSFISHSSEEDGEGPEIEVARREFANILAGAGTVTCMTELLLSGHMGLAHRAAMVLACLSEHPSGAAALLSPMHSDESATIDIDPFSILFILSQGVVLDNCMEAASKAMKTAKKGVAARAPNPSASPAIVSLAKRAVRFTLLHEKVNVEKAAKEAALAWHRVDEANTRSETQENSDGPNVLIEDITDKVNLTSRFFKPVFPVGQLGRHLWTVESILEMVKDDDDE